MNNPLEIMMQKELDDKMYDREYKGFHYWEFVRVYASHDIMRLVSNTSLIFGKEKPNISKYKFNLKELKNYKISKEQKNSDILVLSHPRRIKQGEKYKNIFIDDVVKHLQSKGHKVLTLEEPAWTWYAPTNKAHDFPNETENMVYNDISSLKFRVKYQLMKLFGNKMFDELKQEYEEVKKIISSWYPDVDMSGMDFEYKFYNTIIQTIVRKEEISKLLDEINPKIVLMYFMPTPFKTTLINVCKEKGIPTVELQHGIITETDPIINKCFDRSQIRSATDYIFAFGEDLLNRNYSTVDPKNILNIGFPFLKSKLSQDIKKPDFMKEGKKYILVVSQSTIGKYLAKFAGKLSALLKGTEYEIIFKYHPQEFSRDYEETKKDNIIEIRNEVDTYTIQKFSELQAGVYSTALFEGIGFYLPTLILENVYGADSILNVCNKMNSGIYKINSADEVLKYLKNPENYKPTESDVQLLWSNSDLEEKEKTIKSLMRTRKK